MAEQRVYEFSDKEKAALKQLHSLHDQVRANIQQLQNQVSQQQEQLANIEAKKMGMLELILTQQGLIEHETDQIKMTDEKLIVIPAEEKPASEPTE